MKGDLLNKLDRRDISLQVFTILKSKNEVPLLSIVTLLKPIWLAFCNYIQKTSLLFTTIVWIQR